MARILGLDLGAHSVKALVLESSFRGFAARSWAEAKVGEQGLAGALAELKAGGHLAADHAVVALPGATVATHLLTMPFADARRIDATIAFEVEGQLPFELQDVVFDYQPVEVRNGKTEVLVGVVRKDELSGVLATLQAAGVDPRVVTTSGIAYQNLIATRLLGNPGPGPAEGCEAVVDIGHERTSVCIGTPQGGLDYARTFGGGGKDLTRAVAAEFKVSPADAQAWKENEGDVTLGPDTPPEVERAAAALLRGFAPVLREIRSSLRAHAARFKRNVARVYLTGGTARLKGLDGLLARELGVEVLPLEAVPRNEESQAVPAAAQALAGQAFALAIRGHGAARSARFNLRKGALAFKGDLDYLKGKVSRLAVFAATLAALGLGLVWAQFRVLAVAEDQIDGALCAVTQKILGKCQKDFLVAKNLLKGQSSPAASLPSVSALDLFAEVATRSQEKKVKLEDVEVQLQRVKIRGETESFEGVDQLVEALKGYRCFQDIKRGKIQRNKDGSKVQFDLDINVHCPEDGQPEEGA